ncbi:transposable element Tcb2 transposase [Trichonephila clavipes]|nr:transposable element Tcb2 transposase [Trichonephila clavipes]
MVVGIILRSSTKVSDLAVRECWCMVASPLTGAQTYIIRDGPLTARRYMDEILIPIVVPYAAAIGDDFILMDDNCRPHRANQVEDFLFRGMNRTNGMARLFSRHDTNRALLGRSRKTSFWPPTTPQTLQELKEFFWKSGTEYPNS